MISNNFNQANLNDKLKTVYRAANSLTGGALAAVALAYKRFAEQRADLAAAGMAYYTLFSLFPLLLVLIAIGSSVLESAIVRFQLLNLLAEILPSSRELIERNIDQVLDLRRPVGIISGIGLLWAASSVFTILTDAINRAWPEARTRNFFKRRLIALIIVGTLALLVVLSVLATAALDLVASFQVPLAGEVSLRDTPLWPLGRYLLPLGLRALVFLALYHWAPNTKVPWLAALWGAAFATTGWELTTRGFTWYLSSGLVQYELIYGSLGTVVVLMLWIYLGSMITLFGAHLSAAVALSGAKKS